MTTATDVRDSDAFPTGVRLREGWMTNILLVGVLLAELVFGFLLAVWTDAFRGLPGLPTRQGWPLPLFLLATAATVGTALALCTLAYGELYLATLLAAGPLLPTLTAIAVLVVYLPSASDPVVHGQALYLGSTLAFAAWVFASPGLRWLADVRTAQSRSYGELVLRTEDLVRRVGASGPGLAGAGTLSRVGGYLGTLRSELGLERPPGAGIRYAMGTGYITLWRAVHRAEELLLASAPDDELLGEASYDHMRLAGMDIVGRDDLLFRLTAAMAQFGPAAAPLLPAGAVAVDASAVVRQPARQLIRDVRLTINSFRDDRWEGLIRERNRLLRTIFLTSAATATVVALAVLERVEPKHIAAAAVFYLVGALIGLLVVLRREGGSGAALDDYGLFEAKLLHTPLLSGLAAVAGVFVFAIAPTIFGTDVAAGQAATTSLADVFDLGKNVRGLIAAAVFGLTPELLIGWLRGQGDNLKRELASSQAAVSSADAAPAEAK